MNSKLVASGDIPPLLKTLKKKNKRIVFTNGCFDLIHAGHIKLLKEARKYGDILILGLNSDSSIKKIKGPFRPILKQKARIDTLASIEFIDYIVIFNETTTLRLIKKIKPDVLIKGGDWQKEDIVGSEFVQAYGGKVKRVKLKKGYSTSSIIEKMKKAD